MANNSSIEWTEATWNPTTGCTEVSPGCGRCYAKPLSNRLKAMGQKKYRNGFKFTEHPSTLDQPLRWRKPRKIFVNSMSDLFHVDARMEYVAQCFDVMLRADRHVYQVLTKRPDSMAEFSEHFAKFYGYAIPKHIWMGTSIENANYRWRIDSLRKVLCTVRFLSIEPLIGDIGELDLSGIHWVIVGGESGPNFRPVKKEWIVGVIQQCEEQHVPVFFKQWGGIRPKSGGRMIDGKIYDQYPEDSFCVPDNN